MKLGYTAVTRTQLRHGNGKRVSNHYGANPFKYWCRLPVSNWPPDDYKSTALPNELSRLNFLQSRIILYLMRVSVGLPPFFGGSGTSSEPSSLSSLSFDLFCAVGTEVNAGAEDAGA